MNFSEALEAVKLGNKISCFGWNGANQHVFIINDDKAVVLKCLGIKNA